jgi:DNA modification methylase
VPLVGQVYGTDRATLIQGDCLDVMQSLSDNSVDAVVTDPPYPEISRPYGRMTEAEWFVMMHALIPEVRRVLKPTGSAVFVLQPNSERVGRMRTWLWEFMVWVGKEWGIVQDAWWWNYAAIPQWCSNRCGLMKPAVKACVWLGSEECYRDQGAVLWKVSDYTIRNALRAISRAGRVYGPSGHSVDAQHACQSPIDRGGSAPPNLIPCANSRAHESGGGHGHGAATPIGLCRWWVRYICPPGGTVLDPFSGSGTVGVAAIEEERVYIGVEIDPAYCAIARERLAKAELACVKQKET